MLYLHFINQIIFGLSRKPDHLQLAAKAFKTGLNKV